MLQGSQHRPDTAVGTSFPNPTRWVRRIERFGPGEARGVGPMTLLVGSATGNEPAAGEVRLRTTLLSRARAERRGECRAAPAPAGAGRATRRSPPGLTGGGEP